VGSSPVSSITADRHRRTTPAWRRRPRASSHSRAMSCVLRLVRQGEQRLLAFEVAAPDAISTTFLRCEERVVELRGGFRERAVVEWSRQSNRERDEHLREYVTARPWPRSRSREAVCMSVSSCSPRAAKERLEVVDGERLGRVGAGRAAAVAWIDEAANDDRPRLLRFHTWTVGRAGRRGGAGKFLRGWYAWCRPRT